MSWRLAVVACGPQLEVALEGAGWACASVVRLAGGAPRSALLLAAADLLCEEAGIAPADLDRVVVTRGPGSFTGIRSGLATAHGLAAASGCTVAAASSLLAQAARCGDAGEVWAAQPGRRAEVYAQRFAVAPDTPPRPLGPVEVVPVAATGQRGPWIAAETLDLGAAVRAPAVRTAAEALLGLEAAGVATEPVEPLYVEGPPVHRRGQP